MSRVSGLVGDWRAAANMLDAWGHRQGAEAIRECADQLAKALGGPVDTAPTPEPPSVPEPAACTCGHPRDWHSYDKYACYTGSPAYNKPCPCRTYTPNE